VRIEPEMYDRTKLCKCPSNRMNDVMCTHVTTELFAPRHSERETRLTLGGPSMMMFVCSGGVE